MEQTVSTHHFYRTRLFLFTLIVVLLGAALAGVGVFALLPTDLGNGYGAVISTIQGIGSILVQKVAMIYVVMILGIVVAMIVLHLFYSHRIAGPAYRLALESSRIREGILAGKVKFRQKDNLTDMADVLNQVTERYRGRVDAIKNELSQLEAQTEALGTLVKLGKQDSTLEKAADEITAHINNIRKTLAEMRT
jgi:nitrogen fixation/metabolism regulation signal transduction histidine kinase